MTRPQPTEAASYYSRYTDLVSETDIVSTLRAQLDEAVGFLSAISEEQSLQSYEPGKWTIREVLNHVNDTERIFLYRAFWIGRAFQSPLAGYDQDECVKAAKANNVSWHNLVDEFRGIRAATISFFENLPTDAWSYTGIANENSFTVRALAYIIAGHVRHHLGVIRERYL